MRHSVFGKKLSRTKNERARLRYNLLRSLILHGEIKTTKAKAKAVQALIEKLITKAKTGTEQKRREVETIISDKKIIAMLWNDAKTRFAKRQSGFTRVVLLGQRRGDASEMVLLSFVDNKVEEAIVPVKKTEAVKVKAETKETKKTPVKRELAGGKIKKKKV